MKNPTIIQFFHWYSPGDGHLWTRTAEEAPQLAALGISAVWLPPMCKASNGGYSVGYDIYDLYDLGEFDQKGSIPTKYGTREAYEQAVSALHEAGLQVLNDIILNHKGGADETERFLVHRVRDDNKNELASDAFEIEGWTKFTFPGRNGKYSDFIWDHRCFSGIDYAYDLDERAIFAISNGHDSAWDFLEHEQPNHHDYLMYCDVNFRNEAVRDELKRWGEWLTGTLHGDCFRLDAVKHMAPAFINEWLDHLRAVSGKPLYAVGDFWSAELGPLQHYIHLTGGRISLFDVPLHYRFYEASRQGKAFDLRTILDGTLVQADPLHAATFVESHDSQPLQGLESPVEPWFKPHSYALILLREQGLPCVFEPDLYGAAYQDAGTDGNTHDIVLPKIESLPLLLQARAQYAYGVQHDYFDDPNCIGWTRLGADEWEGSGCAVVLSNGEAAQKWMTMGADFAHAVFIDVLGNIDLEIELNEEGAAAFPVAAGNVSVWIKK